MGKSQNVKCFDCVDAPFICHFTDIKLQSTQQGVPGYKPTEMKVLNFMIVLLISKRCPVISHPHLIMEIMSCFSNIH